MSTLKDFDIGNEGYEAKKFFYKYIDKLHKKSDDNPDSDFLNLEILFEIAMSNKELFPNIKKCSNYEDYIKKWTKSYLDNISPHLRKASPKSSCSDPAITTIVMYSKDIDSEKAKKWLDHHNLFMSAENIQGNLLEEYISFKIRPYGWLWCKGNIFRAIDFCTIDGKTFLQIKNKSNTENSSSSAIRSGTDIIKWYRLGTKTEKGLKIPNYKWNELNFIVSDKRADGFELQPCNMSEQDYIKFLIDVSRQTPEIITDL